MMSISKYHQSAIVIMTKDTAGQAGIKRIAAQIGEEALKEAAERRKKAGREDKPAPKEIKGRGGLDPGRYGDWEVKGLTSDF